MTKYTQGTLYIGTIKRKSEIVTENAMIFYSTEKDLFYGIEVLNEVHDLDNDKQLSPEERTELLKKIESNSYSYHPEENDEREYIDVDTIKPFSEKDSTEERTTNDNLKKENKSR